MFSMDFLAPTFLQDDFGIIKAVHMFVMESEGPVSVMCIAFFAGILRLFAERAVGADERIVDNVKELYRSFFDRDTLMSESSIGKISTGVFGHKHDAWLAWLGLSLVVTLVNTYFELTTDGATDGETQIHDNAQSGASSGEESRQSSQQDAQPQWFMVGLFSAVYVAFGYFLWIYISSFGVQADEVLRRIQRHSYSSRMV